jgi:hypothetical protein
MRIFVCNCSIFVGVCKRLQQFLYSIGSSCLFIVLYPPYMALP